MPDYSIEKLPVGEGNIWCGAVVGQIKGLKWFIEVLLFGCYGYESVWEWVQVSYRELLSLSGDAFNFTVQASLYLSLSLFSVLSLSPSLRLTHSLSLSCSRSNKFQMERSSFSSPILSLHSSSNFIQVTYNMCDKIATNSTANDSWWHVFSPNDKSRKSSRPWPFPRAHFVTPTFRVQIGLLWLARRSWLDRCVEGERW